MQREVLLITGPGGDAQGWGNMAVTEVLNDTLNSLGVKCSIAFVNNREEFDKVMDDSSCDLVWSSLYYLSDREDIVGAPDDAAWISDLLDARGIPYIGSSAQTMKDLILKFVTHEIMAKSGVSVPFHVLVEPGETIPDNVPFPAFVKPNGESRSVGISDRSVVKDRAELEAQVAWVHTELGQGALVEEYLPGDEYTVLMLGNGEHQEILPGKVTVDETHYGKFRILRSDLRGVGLTKVSIPTEHFDEAVELCRKATEALKCMDHVRADMRVGADGKLRIIEVNGIPGLKPVKSWSPQIFSLYHPQGTPEEDYREMIRTILISAFARIGKPL